MALKQLILHYKLNKEKHPVAISDCPNCDGAVPCPKTKYLELPFLKTSCTGCGSIAVRLKDSALVVKPCDGSTNRAILAEVVSWTQLVDKNGCWISEYLITLEYDDEQIVDQQLITEADVDGWDCYTIGDEYLEGKLNCLGEATLEQDVETGVITFTNGEGDTSTANVISADADNLVRVGSDGGAFLADVDVISKTVSIGEADAGSLSTIVTLVNTYTFDTGGIISIVNPSASATMRVLKMVACGVSGTFIPGHAGTFIVEASIDGGAFSTLAFKDWMNSGASDYTGDLVPVLNTDADLLVAISDSYSLQLRLKYQTRVQGAGGGGVSSLYAFFNTYRMLGFVGNNT